MDPISPSNEIALASILISELLSNSGTVIIASPFSSVSNLGFQVGRFWGINLGVQVNRFRDPI